MHNSSTSRRITYLEAVINNRTRQVLLEYFARTQNRIFQNPLIENNRKFAKKPLKDFSHPNSKSHSLFHSSPSRSKPPWGIPQTRLLIFITRNAIIKFPNPPPHTLILPLQNAPAENFRFRNRICSFQIKLRNHLSHLKVFTPLRFRNYKGSLIRLYEEVLLRH